MTSLNRRGMDQIEIMSHLLLGHSSSSKGLAQRPLIGGAGESGRQTCDPGPWATVSLKICNYITFSPNLTGLNNTIKENRDLLTRSSATKLLSEASIILDYKRPQNLRDMLVRVKLSWKGDGREGHVLVGLQISATTKTCLFCPRLWRTDRIKSSFPHR